MFRFVSDKLVYHCSRRCTNTISRSTHCYTGFIVPVLVRRNSSSSITPTSKEQSFTVSYLMNSCGFSLKSALLASKRLQLDSPETPDSVLAFLKSHGFSKMQILKSLISSPRLLLADPQKSLLPKFEFFYSKGFSISEFANQCASYPDILQRSLENTLIPNFDRITDLTKSSEKAIALIKSKPDLLRRNWDVFLAPQLNVLRDIGVPDHNVFLFIKLCRRPLSSNVKILKEAAIEVKQMGIDPLKSQFILAVVAKLYGETHWKSRVEMYKRWGWSEEEFLAACRRNPVFMTLSMDKSTRVMELLVDKMNIESSFIAKYPQVIGYSIENRFIPRAAVFELLVSKGLIAKKKDTLMKMFLLTEESFLKKLVNFCEEAPQLLKLYQEKKLEKKLGCSGTEKSSAILR